MPVSSGNVRISLVRPARNMCISEEDVRPNNRGVIRGRSANCSVSGEGSGASRDECFTGRYGAALGVTDRVVSGAVVVSGVGVDVTDVSARESGRPLSRPVVRRVGRAGRQGGSVTRRLGDEKEGW